MGRRSRALSSRRETERREINRKGRRVCLVRVGHITRVHGSRVPQAGLRRQSEFLVQHSRISVFGSEPGRSFERRKLAATFP
jgi:hypothetical protein